MALFLLLHLCFDGKEDRAVAPCSLHPPPLSLELNGNQRSQQKDQGRKRGETPQSPALEPFLSLSLASFSKSPVSSCLPRPLLFSFSHFPHRIKWCLIISPPSPPHLIAQKAVLLPTNDNRRPTGGYFVLSGLLRSFMRRT